MNVFDTLEDLKPFVFRITDNGGETADRWTVATCDGEWTAMSSDPYSPQGVFGTGEGLDVQVMADRVDAGEERDVTWETLPRDCRRCVVDRLNESFGALAASVVPAATRDAAADFSGWSSGGGADCVASIHLDAEGRLRVRDDERRGSDGEDPGPFASAREAILHLLPEAYDLAGPELHSPIDMWAVVA